jgi:hypothetical protein
MGEGQAEEEGRRGEEARERHLWKGREGRGGGVYLCLCVDLDVELVVGHQLDVTEDVVAVHRDAAAPGHQLGRLGDTK